MGIFQKLTEDYSKRLLHRLQYRCATPKPHTLIRVDPSTVDHKIVPRFYRNAWSYGTHVHGGNWDRRFANVEWTYATDASDRFEERHLIKFENYDLYQSFVEHFRHGIPWEQTQFYRTFEERVAEGTWGSSRYSIENIDDRLSYLDSLYESMRDDGYKTQRELAEGDRGIIDFTLSLEPNEVVIAIGRNGNLYECGGGQHRLMLAKVIGIPFIPVRVFVRHKSWQQLRVNVCREGRVPDTAETVDNYHPDLYSLMD